MSNYCSLLIGFWLQTSVFTRGLTLRAFTTPTTNTPGWHPLGFKRSFESGPKRIEFHQENGSLNALVVWKSSNGSYFSRPDVCAHLGAKLSEGKILENGCLQCPYHGVTFGTNAQHEVAKKCYGIVHEENGLLWWNKDPNEKYFQFCNEINNFNSDSVVTRWEMEVQASFSDCFRNSMDLHHAAYLHESTFGNKVKDPEGIKMIWIDERTMRADFIYYSNDNYVGLTGEKTTNYHIFQSPSTTWNKVLNENGDKNVFVHVAMRATGPKTTKWYLTASTNYVPNVIPNELSEYVMKRITKQVAFVEDKHQLEKMESEDIKDKHAYKITLPLDDIYNFWHEGYYGHKLHCDANNVLFKSNCRR